MVKTGSLSVVLGMALALFATSRTSAIQKSKADNGAFTLPSGGDIVLYSQLDDPSGEAFTDQGFEVAYAAYDSEGGDDFALPAPFEWAIAVINTPGSQLIAGSNPFFVNHAFYADAGGAPGPVLPDCDFPGNTNFTSDGTGDISATVNCNAAPGTVWVSQSVRQDFNPFGQHFWATRATTAGSEGVFRNPGNGFGTGCLDWSPMNSVCGTTGADWLFELLGVANGSGTVPAVGPFGVALMVLALGGGSAYVLRRRRPASRY